MILFFNSLNAHEESIESKAGHSAMLNTAIQKIFEPIYLQFNVFCCCHVFHLMYFFRIFSHRNKAQTFIAYTNEDAFNFDLKTLFGFLPHNC